MSTFLHFRRSSTSQPVFPPAATKKDTPAIPDPQVFTVTSLAPSFGSLPTPSQCAVHLELLEALTWLRNRVYKEAGFSEIFGEDPEKVLWWKAVVEASVERFGIWWKAVEIELKERDAGGKGPLRVFPKDLLPPLDVLMVWHAYMLNPRRYNEDCLRFGMNLILDTAFPWSHIHEAIDNDKWNYALPESAARFFEKVSYQTSDIVDELLWKAAPKVAIKCPACAKSLKAPICEIESEGQKVRGWISDEFEIDCDGCGMKIDKEALCAEKFRKDIKSFIEGGADARMRPTCLDQQGGTYLNPSSPDSFESLDALNELFRTTFPTPPTLSTHPTVASIAANMPAHPALPLCINCYTDTPTPYSLNLAAAVIRQQAFVEKMHRQLWIRSPALMGRLPLDSIAAVRARTETRSVVLIDPPDASGFLSRAIQRAEHYFSMFKLHPGKILVPTLDIDLVWHTTLLSPTAYREYTRLNSGRFVDHNDQLSTGTLDEGFEYTTAAFKDLTGEEYGRCMCWNCETAYNEGLRGKERQEQDKWKIWKRSGNKALKAVRIRVAYYREVEKRRRAGMGGLDREGLFSALKRKR